MLRNNNHRDTENTERSCLLCVCLAVVLVLLFSTSAYGQLPFYTDDADSTPKGKFHLEVLSEYDWLQRSAFPGTRQNTTILSLNYGLTDRIELGVSAPFIKIFNDRTSLIGNPSGFGDTQFGMKIRLLEEREHSILPAASVVFNIEVPTGSVRKQIGSGLADYSFYGIAQKSLSKRTKARFNGGVVFAGNGATGLIGIRARGEVFTANGSVVHDLTPRLRLGAELFGAFSNKFDVSRRQLIGQIGGGYLVAENLEITFGVLGGRYPGSPRVGVQVGLAYDFN
jgi:hypothetical protein